MTEYLFSRGWHPFDRKPVDPCDEAAARELWRSGRDVAVTVGEAVTAGGVPGFTVTIGPEGRDVDVEWYGSGGSIVTKASYQSFAERPDELFLSDLGEYLYPDEDRAYTFRQSTAHRKYLFRPDGYARLRTDVKAAPAVKVEEFHDVDVSSHRVPALQWGDWDRFGSLPDGLADPGE